MFSQSFIFACLASAASAHMLLRTPVPFPGINNSPLEPNGSDFPCKNVAYNAAGISNEFAQGSVQTLAFTGSAVHGGGSCQLSVTTDLAPSKDTVWKVIKSIEGGCPARETPGNLPDNADGPTPFEYKFTVPKDLASGEYVFAWSWFNKVGNREMYMNCAPITVTGSGGSEGFFDTLPDMFVANVGNGCVTPDNTDTVFPNPGNELEQGNKVITPGTNFGAGCAAGTSTPPATGGPDADLPADGGNEAPVTENPQTPVEDPQTPVEEPQTPPADTPADTPATSPSGGFTAGEACSDEGLFNCVGGTSFQQCASGAWSVIQSVAAGTSCVPGTSTGLTMATVRRSFPVRF